MPNRSACSDARRRRCCSFPRALFAGLLCLTGGAAHADTYTVGTPVGSGQCTHATVQAAVAAAAAHPGADVIRITRTQNWTAQQIGIDSDQDLDILGGFATCTAAAPDGTSTVLDGSGGDPRPVFAIRGSGIVRLRNLTITGGDQDGDDNGGGIYYEGGGELDIADTLITDNIAYDGGGIYAVGTTDQAELVLGANVIVSFNTARKSGGGVVANSLEMSLRGPGSSLMFNEARGDGGDGGNGGGLAVVSDRFKAYAYVSSDGIGGIGAVYGNSAVSGGGVAVLGGDDSHDDVHAQIFSTDSANPVRINGNHASARGGGIYTHPHGDLSSSSAVAYAQLRNVAIDDNDAPDGAAIFADHDDYGAVGELSQRSHVSFNATTDVLPDSAAPCPFGTPCGSISGNTTGNATGAIVKLDDADFQGSRVAFTRNDGNRLVHAIGDDPALRVDNSLMFANSLAHELIRQAGDDASIFLDRVTIADNAIGTSYVLHVENGLSFTRSLVSQPGRTVFEAAPPTGAAALVISNDATLAGANTYAAPRFVDPERGDYDLQAGSVAVDYAPVQSGDNGDINSHTRNLDLPGIPNQAGPGDAGAFEREHFGPLVLNSDFNQDLHLWDALGSSAWDATQNASGTAGSGSLHATLGIDDVSLTVRAQCVHLPGPGTYALNGWGRASHGSPFGNQAKLAWELRYDGGVFGCTDGAPDGSGSLILAAGTTWQKPSDPASIDVPATLFTNNTSLTIYAVGVNGNPIGMGASQRPDGGGPEAWFDGITLELAGIDSIFRNGFEAP